MSSQRLRTVLTVLLSLLFFEVATPCLYAFRTAITVGDDIVDRTEGAFRMRSHSELYRYTRMSPAGEVSSGHMLLLFRYGDAHVDGIFRILPRPSYEGAILLLNQPVGKYPDLFLHDTESGLAGFLAPDQRNRKFGDTDWLLEMIYDDDKNPWDHRQLGTDEIRGKRCRVIESRYEPGPFSRYASWSKRQVFISVDGDLPMSVRYFDDKEALFYSMELTQHQRFVMNGQSQTRVRRLMIRDLASDSVTVCHRIASSWETPLSDRYFEPEFVAAWGREQDEEILALINGTQE